MSRIVDVRHPVPMRYVPAGKRKEIFDFVGVRTPVELREAASEDMAHVARVQAPGAAGPLDVFLHDGRYWIKASSRKAPLQLGEYATHPVPVADFLAYLGGGDQPWPDLENHFTRTPLCAVRKGMLAPGKAVDLQGARILGDGTDRARRDLALFLDRNVRVVGGEAYVRLVGPLAFQANWSYKHFAIDRYPRHYFALFREDGYPCRYDRLARYVGFQGGDVQGVTVEGGGWETLDVGLCGDDDVLLVANDAPRRVLAAVEARAPRDRLDPGVRDAFDEALRKVAGWHVRGMTGTITEDEVEETFMDILGVARQVGPLLQEGGWGDLIGLVRWIDGYALPVLREPAPVAEEDADAFQGLAP